MGIVQAIKELRKLEATEMGVMQERKRMVREMMSQTKFSDEEIAKWTKVSVAFVRKVRKERMSQA